jgi:amino acid transporter
MILLGLGHVTGATLLPGPEATIDRLGETSLLLIYAFVGFETIGITAGETANPRKRLPRALLRTVLAIAAVYFLIVLVYVSVIPASAYHEATLVDVGRALAGGAGGLAIALAAVFSVAGNLSQSMLGVPRLLFALGEHGMIPRHFARVHPRYHTPHVAIISMGGLCLALALSGTFTALAVASSLSRLLAYVVCIAALPRIARRASDAVRAEAFALPGGSLIPVVALGICIALILQTTLANWLAVGALLAIGAVLYLIERRAAAR